MSAEAPVLLSVDGGVAHIELNRPDEGNAISLELAQALGRAVEAAATDTAARSVLLTGRGRMFCAGGDLRAMQEAPDRGAFLRELADTAHRAARALARLEKPVVAAVQGSAAGAGFSLVLLSDIVLATPQTAFVTAYAGVGLSPDCGQSWLLPRSVGLPRALELTLTSRKLGAAEAVESGLVSRLVDEGALLHEARTLAQQFADGPAHALGAARALLRRSMLDGFDAHLDDEATTISRLAGTEESGRIIASFAGGRTKP